MATAATVPKPITTIDEDNRNNMSSEAGSSGVSASGFKVAQSQAGPSPSLPAEEDHGGFVRWRALKHCTLRTLIRSLEKDVRWQEVALLGSAEGPAGDRAMQEPLQRPPPAQPADRAQLPEPAAPHAGQPDGMRLRAVTPALPMQSRAWQRKVDKGVLTLQRLGKARSGSTVDHFHYALTDRFERDADSPTGLKVLRSDVISLTERSAAAINKLSDPCKVQLPLLPAEPLLPAACGAQDSGSGSDLAAGRQHGEGARAAAARPVEGCPAPKGMAADGGAGEAVATAPGAAGAGGAAASAGPGGAAGADRKRQRERHEDTLTPGAAAAPAGAAHGQLPSQAASGGCPSRRRRTGLDAEEASGSKDRPRQDPREPKQPNAMMEIRQEGEALDALVNEQTSRVQRLKEEVGALAPVIEALQRKVTGMEQLRNGLEASLERKEAQMAGLRARHDELEAQLKGTQASAAALERRCDDLGANLQDTEARTAGLSEPLASFQAKLHAVTAEVEDLLSSADDVSGTIASGAAERVAELLTAKLEELQRMRGLRA